MTNTQLTYLLAGGAGVLSLAAWIGLIVVPAWAAYSRLWERLVALAMSVYVLAAFVLAGAGLAALLLYYYDRL
ncbi:MAG: hypothetical protein H0V22_11350 [Solirubrobacterales bacterium]|nr:hypothetical protein [Solirubrobacterales bacterium]